jgi:metal-sulfur cluster biosynthetic enzyme
VVNLERVYLRNPNLVEVYYTPTIPHCSMAQMIGLMLRVKLLRFLPRAIKSRVMVTPGTHANEM